MEKYLKLSEISGLSSLSVKTIRKHLDEIPHCRPTGRVILMRWSDMKAWLTRSQHEALADPYVREILEKMHTAGVN